MVELIVTLEDTASANLLRKTISLLKGVKQVVTVRKNTKSKQQLEQLSRLKELSDLKSNWDGDGALPIDKTVLKNARAIVGNSNDTTLSSWTFFPEVNGTIVFQKNDNSAIVSIGKKDFSAVSDTKAIAKQPFSPESVVSFISL